MTTPNERARALVWTGGFLVELARDPRLPLDVRQQAIVMARHFPTAHEVAFAAGHSPASGLGLALIFNPKIFPPELELGGMAFIAAWWGVWHIVAGSGLAFYWGRKKKSPVIAPLED